MVDKIIDCACACVSFRVKIFSQRTFTFHLPHTQHHNTEHREKKKQPLETARAPSFSACAVEGIPEILDVMIKPLYGLRIGGGDRLIRRCAGGCISPFRIEGPSSCATARAGAALTTTILCPTLTRHAREIEIMRRSSTMICNRRGLDPWRKHAHTPPAPCSSMQLTQLPYTQQTQRRFSSRGGNGKGGKRQKKKVDDNAPLLNEHLIAELFNKKKRDGVTADTYEVRLIVDQGRNKNEDDSEDDTDDDGGNTTDAAYTPTSQITTIENAMNIAHDLSLDLMEVTIKQTPPVIKAVDYDKWLYEQKKKTKLAASKKRREGGGAISDRPLKEFKFRAGIADHDLGRKADNMIKYLGKGHAIRVTLTARQRMLNEDDQAIATTLERVKELVGDRAVEVRSLKANDRKSYGSLLLHPSKSSKV